MGKKPQRTIIDVLNIETGENTQADEFFSKPLDEITVYRSELQKAIEGYRDPLFVCYFCKQKIRIRGGISKSGKRKVDIFHFAHLKDSKECHIKTNNKFTKDEVNRIKYNGEKESLLHQTLKHQIANFLERNEKTKGEISSVEVEKIIKDKVISEWKKPDINAFFLDKRMAIELQLSTTWLDVITRRQHFYKNQNIYIFWVFHVFDINDDIRKLTYNDVVFTNNQNAFVFNNETYELSQKANDLILKCYYKEYYSNDMELEERWTYSFVTLSQLTFNSTEHCIYFHDSKQQKKNIQFQIEERILKIQEDKRLRLQKEEKRKKRVFELEYKIEYFENKLKGINFSVNKILDKENDLKTNKNKKANFLLKLDEYTKKTVDYFSKESNFMRPFYDNEPLLQSLKDKFQTELRLIVQAINIKKGEQEKLNRNLLAISNLKQVEVAGIKYHSLNKDIDWDFIKRSYTEIKVIEKEKVMSLFASTELKPIRNEYELSRLQVSENKYFLIDFSNRINDFNKNIKENKEVIDAQENSLIKITNAIKELISTTVNSEIDAISSEIEELEEQKEKDMMKIEEIIKKINKARKKITAVNNL